VVGSETPRGFNHGPAMGPVVSTTNNGAFISRLVTSVCTCRSLVPLGSSR
jgi:hypothetical protein